jgi:DNA-binding NtrC family response regulator
VHEAKEIIQAQDFDVFQLDFNIDKEGDGFEVLESLREVNPESAAIFLLTGYPHFETALRAIQNEIDSYVVKPANVEELVTLIERKLWPRRSPVVKRRQARCDTTAKFRCRFFACQMQGGDNFSQGGWMFCAPQHLPWF